MNGRLFIALALFATGCFSAQSIETGKYACTAQTDCLSGFVCYEGACCKQDKVTGLCVDHPCIKEGTDYDRDGFPLCAGDCDDQDPARFPGGNEACDGKDNNCNNVADEGAGVTRYRDMDSDGHGSNKPEDEIIICATFANGPNLSTSKDDCDDTNDKRFGGNPELCDGIDNNCNDQIDDGQTSVFYEDKDGDTFGRNDVTTQACAAPAGYSAKNNDCQDNSPNIHPGAAEQCNGFDDDCDGLDDTAEGVTQSFFPDGDSDGYGRADAGIGVRACSPPAGYAPNNSDCDDALDTISPAAAEACNGRDDNCNGFTDEGVRPAWFKDADNDQYGNTVSRVFACAAPDASFVARGGDCNDADAGQSPGLNEVCNTVDDNCNGFTDEGVTRSFWKDADVDRFGDPSVSTLACGPPATFVNNPSDCDDSSASRYPGAFESCDGVDNNCDGIKDNDPRCGPRSDFAEDGALWGGQVSLLQAAQATDAGCIAGSAFGTALSVLEDTSTKVSGNSSIRTTGSDVDFFLYTPATRNAAWDLRAQRLLFAIQGSSNAWTTTYRQPVVFFCGPSGHARFEPATTVLGTSFSSLTLTIPATTTAGAGYTYGGSFSWSQVDWVEVHVNNANTGSTTLWIDDFKFVAQ